MEENTMLNEREIGQRRGTTLKVLAILSWVYMGLALFSNLSEFAQGPLTAEEMEFEKQTLLESASPQAIQVMGEEFYHEVIRMLETSTQYFYFENGLDLVFLVIGFIGVMMMYRLKKTGYYLYVLYSAWPIVFTLAFYGTGFLSLMLTVYYIVFSALFCILYGYQLKRMS